MEGSSFPRECPARHIKQWCYGASRSNVLCWSTVPFGGGQRTTRASHSSKLRNAFSHSSLRNLTYFRSIFLVLCKLWIRGCFKVIAGWIDVYIHAPRAMHTGLSGAYVEHVYVLDNLYHSQSSAEVSRGALSHQEDR